MVKRLPVVFLLCCVACGGDELQFADWVQIVPPEGTPIHEYAPVSLEEREGRRIEVIEDLVIGDEVSNPEEVFYRSTWVAVGDDGAIYVLDAGNHRIQVFDAEGGYLRTMGQEGQGPGEFTSPSNMVVGGGHVILRAESRRLSVWTLDGEHVRDTQQTRLFSGFAGTDDGYVASYRVRSPAISGDVELPTPLIYALFDAGGEEHEAYAEFVEPPMTTIEVPGGGMIGMSGAPINDLSFRFVAAPSGQVYATASREYQIHAFGPDPWALRVAWPRQAVSQNDVDTAMLRMNRPPLDQLEESDFNWPDSFRAIVAHEVDGHGHLYVFPFFAPLHAPIGPDEERPEMDRPVDVYSASGEHLFSGMIPVASWYTAQGDFVYTSRVNDLTDEYEVVRYRLAEPFD